MNPMVSIVIPTLNEGKYLESTLKSIENQNYKGKIEIIISDGVSKDDTVKVARKYTNKIIVKKSNLSKGRNLGANEAKGEILFFLDADTILSPNTISEVVKSMLKEKAVGATTFIMPLSNKLEERILYLAYNQYVKVSLGWKLFRPHMPGTFNGYTREAFNKVSGFNETPGVVEDLDISERVSKVGKLIFVKSTTVVTSTRRIAKWGIISSIYRYLKYRFTRRIDEDEYEPIR